MCYLLFFMTLFPFYRYIHLVTACGIVRFCHRHHTGINHRSDIDIHHIFPGFQSQVLHDIKQRLRCGAKLQKLTSSYILLIGLSCVVFLCRFLNGGSSQLHGQHHIVRTCFLPDGWKRPAQILLSAYDFVYSASGFLGTPEHHEHLLQYRVTANATPSLEILLLGNQHHTLIHEYKTLIGALRRDSEKT